MGYTSIDLSSDEAHDLNSRVEDIMASAKELMYWALSAHVGKPMGQNDTPGTINTALVLAESDVDLAPTKSDIEHRHRIVVEYSELLEESRAALEELIEEWRREEWEDKKSQRAQLKQLHRVMANLTKRIVAWERRLKQTEALTRGKRKRR
jgi:hypothetical protein